MAEQLQELIERINREGVRSAETKAEKILSEAEEKAQGIIEEADRKAKEMIETAESEAEKTRENAEKAIRQSFRNVMLSLQDEIKKYFNNILIDKVGESLNPEALKDIIVKVSEKCADQIADKKKVTVLLSPDDAEKLSRDLIASFREKVGRGLTIKPVAKIDAGFMISFDGGESSYDFTDHGLQEILSTYLSSQLEGIISDQ